MARIFTAPLRAALFVAGLLAIGTHSATASTVAPALSLWGTEAFVGTCPVTGCGVRSGFATSNTIVDFHGLGANNALGTLNDGAQAHALLTAASGLSMPKLTARASGPVLDEGIATAIGTYKYTGSATTRTLNANLSGSITNPNKSPLNSIQVGVAIFDALTLENAVTDFKELAASASSLAFGKTVKLSKGTPKALKTLVLTLTATGTKTGTITLPLANGASFYIVSSLLAESGKGGTADAMHTFTLGFNNNLGLKSPSSVPVPAAAWLLGSSVLGLAGLSRRRRASTHDA